MVYVRGKRYRQVPVLMSHDEVIAIHSLIQHREIVGVVPKNPFVFAAPTRGSMEPLRGNDCMRHVLSKLSLQAPERIHSNELRKFCATVSQIADLSENDLRWLAEHLGHDLNVHREYYRLKDSTVELSKVSRLLLAIDEGNAGSLMEKKLADISVEGNLCFNQSYFLILLYNNNFVFAKIVTSYANRSGPPKNNFNYKTKTFIFCIRINTNSLTQCLRYLNIFIIVM